MMKVAIIRKGTRFVISALSKDRDFNWVKDAILGKITEDWILDKNFIITDSDVPHAKCIPIGVVNKRGKKLFCYFDENVINYIDL